MSNEYLNYVQNELKANIRIDFFSGPLIKENSENSNKENNTKYTQTNLLHSIKGFLSGNNFDISLINQFSPALELGGSIFAQLAETLAEIRSVVGKTDMTVGYISTGLKSDTSFLMNAPVFWQGTRPITFNIQMYQIGSSKDDVINSYIKALSILSPKGELHNVSTVEGPGILKIHLFPIGENGEGEGKIVFGPCVCESLTVSIAPPFSERYTPIFGIYNFSLQTNRILMRKMVEELFKYDNLTGK